MAENPVVAAFGLDRVPLNPELTLFFAKTETGNSAFCNLCLGKLFRDSQLFPDDPEGPLLLSQVEKVRPATPRDLMRTCHGCDEAGTLSAEVPHE